MALQLAFVEAGRHFMTAASMWVATWMAAPAPQVLSAPDFPERVSPSFAAETVVQDLRIATGGERLRLRLSNQYGDTPVEIEDISVRLKGADGAFGAPFAVTFSGSGKALLPAGAPLVSDPVPLAIPDLAELRISMFLPHATGPCTCHSRAEQPSQVFMGRTAIFDGPPDRRVQQRVFLAGVEIEREERTRLIVAFGDSITDGIGSTISANRRWPDILAERAVVAGAPIGIVNAGIAGNYLTRVGEYGSFGEPGLARFDRDVLAVSGVTDVVVLAGINDIGGTPSVGAAELIAAYEQLIVRARSRGVRIVLGTLPPFRGASYFTDAGESTRQTVNSWIRSTANTDGVIDFDRALRDHADPSRMRAEYHSGDWLHPSDAGYRAMASAVDLSLFTDAVGHRSSSKG